LEDPVSDRRIILKRILKKYDRRYEVYAFNSGWGAVTDSRELIMNLWGSMICRDCVDLLSKY
jgi:hypothetical protein